MALLPVADPGWVGLGYGPHWGSVKRFARLLAGDDWWGTLLRTVPLLSVFKLCCFSYLTPPRIISDLPMFIAVKLVNFFTTLTRHNKLRIAANGRCRWAGVLQVDLMDTVFTELMQHPPITKNQPPVAGAINWERSMFHRIKRPMLRFLQVSVFSLY